jgi:hypothetical protein
MERSCNNKERQKAGWLLHGKQGRKTEDLSYYLPGISKRNSSAFI